MAKERINVSSVLADLLPKLNDQDPDIRFMSLSDLQNTLRNPGSSLLATDLTAASRVFEGLLKGLNDSNGEVQNEALKWSGPSVT